jgi:mono/diheme cytochrome c family protein
MSFTPRIFVCILLPLLLARPVLARDLPNLSAEARRGERLVATGGCHHCHTPAKVDGDQLFPDTSRLLSGYPDRFEGQGASRLDVGWLAVAVAARSAFTGPWGTSFAANLTADPETGLGQWTEQTFVHVMRTGRHLWSGQPFLPPMRREEFERYSDAELKEIWAYLKSVPPVRNQVPAARPPTGSNPGE